LSFLLHNVSLSLNLIYPYGGKLYGGKLCIIFLTVPCGEDMSTDLVEACPIKMMQE